MRVARVKRGLVTAVLGLAALAGCGLPRATIMQGGGLPVLRPLDWGAPVYDAAWSPNGRWIAVLAGNDYAGSHLAVVSPDGRYQRNLSAWGCQHGPIGPTFSFAWRPDSVLSCINNAGRLITGAYPFTRPQVVAVSPPLTPFYYGAAWSPDGAYLVVASLVDPWDPEGMVTDARLYVVDPSGRVTAPLAASGGATFALNNPRWVPGAGSAAISWDTGNDMVQHDLMVSAVTVRNSQPALGTPRVLATDIDDYYAWSPSGHWAVVRYADYRGGDRVYLVEAAHPTTTLDVVHAERTGQPLANPIWSPDGQTLIVIGVADDQPYAIDIASYLHSKGLAP